MKLGELRPPAGSKRNRKRVGRGTGSTLGKTCGKGQNGQKVRRGASIRTGFEGGQTPLHRRLPKQRGVSGGAMPIGMFRREYAVLNVGRLEAFETGTKVTPELLREQRLMDRRHVGLRILGDGELTKPLTVVAHHFSAAAREKIESAGGAVEVI
ncbi:MAG: 50S ribosomal protein L15 [Armatimonadetes bacterium]|nr:50S ribosomal protein L15 [Armatimonadota bacterium]NDK11753.1 50S ribosomal protein L15 [Armatimonadota bacterium]